MSTKAGKDYRGARNLMLWYFFLLFLVMAGLVVFLLRN